MQKAMSWAQLGRVPRKSRADLQLRGSPAPGPSAPVTSVPRLVSAPAPRLREKPSQLAATTANFPKGGGRSRGVRLPPSNHHRHPQPPAGESTNRRRPRSHLQGLPGEGEGRQGPRRPGRPLASAPRGLQRGPAPGTTLRLFSVPERRPGLQDRERPAPLPALPSSLRRPAGGWASLSPARPAPR